MNVHEWHPVRGVRKRGRQGSIHAQMVYNMLWLHALGGNVNL